MNSITYLGPQVYEVGQIKNSMKIVQEPELSIVQFLIADMKSHYFQNKSFILSKPEFTDIDKKFGVNSVLQTILVDREELDLKSLILFIQKVDKLTKQFKLEQEYSDMLNILIQNILKIQPQKGNDIFQYQFDLINENIDFANEIYVPNDQLIQNQTSIILELLIYNIQLYISQFTTCDYIKKESKFYIIVKEQQQPQKQQQPLITNFRLYTQKLSEVTNNTTPKQIKQSLLKHFQAESSQRISKSQLSQNITIPSGNQQSQLPLNSQQIQIQEEQHIEIQKDVLNNEKIVYSEQNINKLGEVLQKKQDNNYFKQLIFWNSKPRRSIFFNFTQPNEQIDRLCSIFQRKSIFYSCDNLLLYNNVEDQNGHSFILKIEQFFNTEVKCYSQVNIANQPNFKETKNLIMNNQNLKQILNLRDDQTIYHIIVDDLRLTLIEQFSMELDNEIIACL